MWVRFITLAFVCNGLMMTSNKMFCELRQDGRISSYLLVFFGSALLGALSAAIRGKVAPTGRELKIGIFIGLCGLLSFVFLLGFLKNLPGIVVFPVVSGGNPMVVALGAYGIFHERLGVKGVLGVIAGCLGIVLLSV